MADGAAYVRGMLAQDRDRIGKVLQADGLRRFEAAAAGITAADRSEAVREYGELFRKTAREMRVGPPSATDEFIGRNDGRVKALWGDCLAAMRTMQAESVGLMATSPPYYNARAYAQWPDLDAFLADMRLVIAESHRILANHRAFVFNVGDVTGNDHRHTRASWGVRRIPLGAYFTAMFEEAGFRFVDDIIWDKGEVQSNRHKNASTPYPYYQYPMNCYEHLLVFVKHAPDPVRYPCPVCASLKVNVNGYLAPGVPTWECKNPDCFERSAGDRGKRFSSRTLMTDALRRPENEVEPAFMKRWRRDIVPLTPVIKINSKGENTLGHTAPFPPEIPEFAVRMYSGVGDIVLDPFGGSFTTPVEAVRLGRLGVGVELQKGDFRAAITRNVEIRHGIVMDEMDI